MAKDLRRLRPIISRWMSLRHWRSQLVFWSGGLLVGVVAVFVAVICDRAQDIFRLARGFYWWIPLILTPPLGMWSTSMPAGWALSCGGSV